MLSKIRVWDIPTRIFHWSLASLFLFLILSVKVFDNMMEWHMRAGYAVLALILFRILWGLFGSHFSRFTQFLRSPVTALRYLGGIVSGKAEHTLGHNPAGGWMVIFLLLGMGLQGLTGLFISDEIFWDAPFYGALSDDLTSIAGQIHHTLQNVLIGFVCVHIAAVLWHRFRYQDPLIGAMIHGNKPSGQASSESEHRFPLIAFLIIAALSVSLFVWLWMQPI